jgi:hypothetical protein
MQRLFGADQTEAWRLLRVLLVWRRAVPPDTRSAGERVTNVESLLATKRPSARAFSPDFD